MRKIEEDLIKHLQEENKDNCIIKFAVADGRDYVTPEDVHAAKVAGIDRNIIYRDALECLADGTGYGVEDNKTFAFSAIS